MTHMLEWLSWTEYLFESPANSYVEDLTPNMKIFGGGAFWEVIKVLRVEPPWQGWCPYRGKWLRCSLSFSEKLNHTHHDPAILS